jgi:hypothetical protein
MLHQIVFGVYNALHPSTLQTNLGPSLAQWTPSMATRRGATTSMVTPFMVIGRGATTFETKKKYTKPNVIINILDESYFYTMRVLQL